MQEDKIEIPGEEDAQETEIDLDAPAPEQSLEEEKIDVEEVREDSSEPTDAPAESDEQPAVQADKEELGEYSEGVKKRTFTNRFRKTSQSYRLENISYAFSS